MSEPVRRSRRWFSLSLRGMLVLILILGVLVGWRARRAHRQRRAVAAIEAMHGEIRYDWQPPSDAFGFGSAPALGHPPGPPWLRRLLGDEYFQEVVEVTTQSLDLSDDVDVPSPFSPEDGPERQAFHAMVERKGKLREAKERDQLACLEGLDRLETLSIWRPPLRPEGMARLGRLASLKDLTVISFPIDAAGLAEIAKLSQLERLTIELRLPGDAPLALLERLPRLQHLAIHDGSQEEDPFLAKGNRAQELISKGQVTDAWLARIGRIGSLTHLRFDNCSRVTDAGLAHLGGLGRLETLSMGGLIGLGGVTRITDAGLAHLGGLKALKILNLACAAEIGDEGLAHLRGLGRLEHLTLTAASKVTDAGVAHLEPLRNLDWLELNSASRLTDAGVESLARLPALRALDVNVHSMTEAGIARLGTLRSLKFLVLTGAKVRGEVLDDLAAAHPGLAIQAERIEEDAAPDDAPAPTAPRAPDAPR